MILGKVERSIVDLSTFASSCSSNRFKWDEIISIEDIVSTANGIFLQDQRASGGDATKCCANGNPCGSAAGICLHFYDSAPSGRFGTINYFLRALLRILRIDETTVCSIS